MVHVSTPVTVPTLTSSNSFFTTLDIIIYKNNISNKFITDEGIIKRIVVKTPKLDNSFISLAGAA